MATDWTKIAATVGGALIVALQGVNITQGVAISGNESRIESIEAQLSRANEELNKKILANQERFEKVIDNFNAKLDEIKKLQEQQKKP